jgi:hypothetical protein
VRGRFGLSRCNRLAVSPESSVVKRTGLFHAAVGSSTVSLKVRPTAKLIEEVEAADAPKKSRPTEGSVIHNIHVHGPNSRFNLNSIDNSVNTASTSNDKMFVQMREAAQSISDESERATIISRLDALESAKGTTGFLPAYQSFISSVADYMTIFGPFIPVLTRMLSGG